MLTRLLALCGLMAAWLGQLSDANVIGLDLGTDSMKIALVQPGKAMEIVTNFQSKRKTPTCITFYRGERLFGSDSYSIMARKPELTFTKVQRMLGRDVEHPQVTAIPEKQYFPYDIYRNDTSGTLSLKQEDGGFYTPEEIMAMLLQHARDITTAFGGQAVKDCVITVPAHFTQHERRALFTAAEIADLRILTLMEENTAAALHFGIDRVFETPHTILYYNMGASSVQVSIVTYSSYIVKEGGKNKTVGQFEVVGKGWDHSLGGFDFDVKLAELLADRFNEAWSKKASGKGKNLKDFVRPMTRLRLEANKIKEVLSANLEFPVRAEQLHAEVDLNTKVTRADFEAACESLFAKMTGPIDVALAMANLTVGDIQAVELLGGGVRMPRVKRTLDDYFKAHTKVEVGQHLNGDEAMALGAAFRAANLSTAFRVRRVGMQDLSSFGVQVQLESLDVSKDGKSGKGLFGGLFGGGKKDKDKKGDATEGAEAGAEGGGPWKKQTGLYVSKATVPAKAKTVAFQHNQDILCRVEYDSSAAGAAVGANTLPEGTNTLLAVYNITGIAEFAEENSHRGLGHPKIHLSFALDSSGVVQLSKAEATLELPPDKEEEAAEAAAKAAAAAAGDANATESASASDATNTAAASEGKEVEDASNSTSSSSSSDASSAEGDIKTNGNDTTTAADAAGKDKDKDKDKTKGKDKGKGKDKKTKSADEKRKAKKDRILRRVLTVSEHLGALTPPIWSAARIAESRSRLRALDAADKARRDREAALNDLEGYIYKVRGRFEDEADVLKTVSTEAQREEVDKLCASASEWLEEEGHKAELKDFKAKHAAIVAPAEAIFLRKAELKKRPDSVKTATDLLASVRAAVSIWNDTHPQITEAETTTFLEAVTVAEAWISKNVEAQAAKAGHEEPAFFSKDVKPITDGVAAKMQVLLKKPKPKPVPIVKETNSTTDGTSSANSTTDGDASGGANNNETEPVRVKVTPDEQPGEQPGQGDSAGSGKSASEEAKADEL